MEGRSCKPLGAAAPVDGVHWERAPRCCAEASLISQFADIFVQMVVLFAVGATGYAAKRLNLMDEDFDKKFSKLILNTALPALILASVLTAETLPSATKILWTAGVSCASYVVLVAIGFSITAALRVPDGRTSTYVFVGDSDGDMAVAVADMEICEKLTPDYFASQKELLDGAAAVVVDANLPRESIAYLVEHCAAPLFVDPVSTVKAEKLQGLLSHVHTLKPNRIEAELLSGVKITDNATLHQAAQALLDQGVQRVFLSLGGDGVFAVQQGETHLEPICKAEMRNATGAGDAMMASLVWSFLAGRDLAESCAAGTAAAAIAVESEETINPNMSAEAVLARAAK